MGCHFGRPSKFLPPPLQFGAPLFGLQTMGPTFFFLSFFPAFSQSRSRRLRSVPLPLVRLLIPGSGSGPPPPSLAGRGTTACQCLPPSLLRDTLSSKVCR